MCPWELLSFERNAWPVRRPLGLSHRRRQNRKVISLRLRESRFVPPTRHTPWYPRPAGSGSRLASSGAVPAHRKVDYPILSLSVQNRPPVAYRDLSIVLVLLLELPMMSGNQPRPC